MPPRRRRCASVPVVSTPVHESDDAAADVEELGEPESDAEPMGEESAGEDTADEDSDDERDAHV